MLATANHIFLHIVLHTAHMSRLLQLLIKGLLYESCVEFCQRRATGKGGGVSSESSSGGLEFSSLLRPLGCDNMLDDDELDQQQQQQLMGDSDTSLLSWLQSIPPDVFACPFEQKTLNVDVRRLRAPKLETRCELVASILYYEDRVSQLTTFIFSWGAKPQARRVRRLIRVVVVVVVAVVVVVMRMTCPIFINCQRERYLYIWNHHNLWSPKRVSLGITCLLGITRCQLQKVF